MTVADVLHRLTYGRRDVDCVSPFGFFCSAAYTACLSLSNRANAPRPCQQG